MATSNVSFGAENQGFQVGQSYAPINAEFHFRLAQPESTPAPYSTIPFRRDPDFVICGDILQKMDLICSQPASRVALVGLGGVGKSQQAIEFAYQFAETHGKYWVFWIHGSTQARVMQDFRVIADVVKIPGRNEPKADIPQLVYTWLLNESNGKWLVILDSADTSDILYGKSDIAQNARVLADYLPQSQHGSIVLTTRDESVALRFLGNQQYIIKVGPMTELDALRLLENRLGLLSNKAVAKALVLALDHVPLAISQAAAYIKARSPRSSLERYLEEFHHSDSQRDKLLRSDAGDPRRDGSASNAIFTTWQVSFDYICSKRRSAADLLSLMSFFDRQGIHEALLKPPTTATNFTNVKRACSLSDQSDSDSECEDGYDDGTFEDDVQLLRDFSLISTNSVGDVFEMHRLVQLATWRWLERNGLKDSFMERYISRMAAKFPHSEYENWETCSSLFAHAEAAFEYRSNKVDVKMIWASLLHKAGKYAWEQGKLAVAERMIREVKATREETMGTDDFATLATAAVLGSILKDNGDYKNAEELLLQSLETCKTKLGVRHPATLTCMIQVGHSYYRQGRWNMAEQILLHAIEICKTILGGRNPHMLMAMSELAMTYHSQGRWEEAETLYKEVIKTQRKILGAEHPDTLKAMTNLASMHHSQGRWEEAKPLQEEVLETRRKILGAEHPDTLMAIANLATTYHSQDRWEEAETLYKEVLEIQRKNLGAEHPDTLTVMSNLAITLRAQRRETEAFDLLKNCAEASRRVLGLNHPDTVMMLSIIEKWRR